MMRSGRPLHLLQRNLHHPCRPLCPCRIIYRQESPRIGQFHSRQLSHRFLLFVTPPAIVLSLRQSSSSRSEKRGGGKPILQQAAYRTFFNFFLPMRQEPFFAGPAP
jgi:hypothetical protein